MSPDESRRFGNALEEADDHQVRRVLRRRRHHRESAPDQRVCRKECSSRDELKKEVLRDHADEVTDGEASCDPARERRKVSS
jgi:hypothetical protein